MATVAFGGLLFAIVGIAALFYSKHRELATGSGIVPVAQLSLDQHASRLKELASAVQSDLKRVAPFLMYVLRAAVHASALWIARVARGAEAQAHRLADMVSHKHRFVQRAPRSEFLQKITEHKNGKVEMGEDTVHNSEASQ